MFYADVLENTAGKERNKANLKYTSMNLLHIERYLKKTFVSNDVTNVTKLITPVILKVSFTFSSHVDLIWPRIKKDAANVVGITDLLETSLVNPFSSEKKWIL